ncbi:uncharacterized protein LOC119100246 [Pollicipes pollicipes]|uniref:uncharacterized protein LOC119100246 n=1 Tax=Pollicipes pollicipes TaxID=41117 RepID=UPI001884F08D|nr:uncharacterized protein LOC119100246 [Pollicipes pollicipes]
MARLQNGLGKTDTTLETPQYALLWDSIHNLRGDLEDRYNLTLNVDGKGLYLSGLGEEDVSASHRLNVPFPLRSSTTAADYDDQQDPARADCDGAAFPFLTGALIKGGPADPVRCDVDEYWKRRAAAHCSAKRAGRLVKDNPKMDLDVLLRAARDPAVTHLPNAAFQMRNALPFVHFLTHNPVFMGWDTKHNWLYAGGCVSVLPKSSILAHVRGDSVALAHLTDCEVGDACPLALHGEDAMTLNWPYNEPVLQVQTVDDEHVALAVRSQEAARYCPLQGGVRLSWCDEVLSPTPLTAAVCQPTLAGRWTTADAAGRLLLRDAAASRTVQQIQLPEVARPYGWFGLHAGPDQHRLLAASWECMYTIDTRAPEAAVTFRLSANDHLCPPGDRLHALRRSVCRDHLSLVTSSRHLNVLDDRWPAAPWLRSRLTVPGAEDASNCTPLPRLTVAEELQASALSIAGLMSDM